MRASTNGRGADGPDRRIAKLYRYPVKGLTPEVLCAAFLEPGRGFPWDRAMALTDGTWEYDPDDYVPLFKDRFLALLTHPELAALTAKADPEAERLTITAPSGEVFVIDPAQGSAEFTEFLRDHLGLPADRHPQLIRRTHGSFTDLAALDGTGAYRGTVRTAISLMNLASVRDLAGRMGDPELDPRRLRANVLFDSGTAWEEADWVGRYVRVGTAVGKIIMATPRCGVPAVNPVSGARDRNVLKALWTHYGNNDLGCYLDVVEPGMIRPGDPVELVDHPGGTHELHDVAFRRTRMSIYVGARA